jgi:hypothetical protein
MTIVEKALEQTLHAAIAAKDLPRIRDAYERGADLIAGVFGQPMGKMSCRIIAWALG